MKASDSNMVLAISGLLKSGSQFMVAAVMKYGKGSPEKNLYRERAMDSSIIESGAERRDGVPTQSIRTRKRY
jgi:hypothetical protein